MTEHERVAGASNRRIQVCTAVPRTWTKAKREAFLDHLAVTSNVSLSAAKVGISLTSVYALRKRDTAFSDAFDAALERGYDYLEAQLLARAIGQDADPDRPHNPEAVPFDPDMAIRVLTLRKGQTSPNRNRGGPRMKRVTIDELEKALRVKLDALAKRLKVDI